MAEKLFELAYSETGKTTIYGIILQRATGYYLNDADGLFASAPADKFLAATEHAVLKGIYQIIENRSEWPDGAYLCAWYDKAGASENPAIDYFLGTTVMDVVANAAAPASSTSSILICNNAILSLGGNVIVSFDDTTTEGVLCKNFWAQAVDTVLRLHPWNAAVKRAQLTPDVAAPVYEWLAAFTLPSDLLRILDLDGVVEYKVEGRKILCDETALNIRYVYRNETPATWDALLIQAMTAYMAFLLAYPLTKSNTTRGEQWKLFTELLRTARDVDAQEEPPITFGDFPFINVRG